MIELGIGVVIGWVLAVAVASRPAAPTVRPRGSNIIDLTAYRRELAMRDSAGDERSAQGGST